MAKISALSKEAIIESEFLVCKDIKFISEEQILSSTWEAAFELVKDIDENDIHYVAFSNQFHRKIWSGDRHLIKGLARKGFGNFITTNELYAVREELKRSKGRGRK